MWIRKTSVKKIILVSKVKSVDNDIFSRGIVVCSVEMSDVWTEFFKWNENNFFYRGFPYPHLIDGIVFSQ
jgi:hypothetical protein